MREWVREGKRDGREKQSYSKEKSEEEDCKPGARATGGQTLVGVPRDQRDRE